MIGMVGFKILNRFFADFDHHFGTDGNVAAESNTRRYDERTAVYRSIARDTIVVRIGILSFKINQYSAGDRKIAAVNGDIPAAYCRVVI